METMKKVLLVDDDNDFIEMMKLELEKEYAIETAGSGEECLEKVKTEKPDCIVLDVIMNTLSDGLDTAKKLKSVDETKSIPIIMLTSVNKYYDYRSQIDEDYFPKDVWLDKPVKGDRLKTEIKKLLN